LTSITSDAIIAAC